MSYDISLTVMKPVDVLDINYTYNVGSMFRLAIGQDGLYTFNGKTGKECSPLLKQAIERMEIGSDEYIKLNPSNGWGNYDGALEVLKKMLASCEEYPDRIIEIN